MIMNRGELKLIHLALSSDMMVKKNDENLDKLVKNDENLTYERIKEEKMKVA